MSDPNNLEATLDKLINAGEKPKPEILERVKAFGAVAVPRLIEIATSEELNTAPSDSPRVYAPLHAIQILGELRAVEAIEPLLPMIAWDEDDWLDNYLPDFFGRVGEPAIAPLERILANNSKTIYTHVRVSQSLTHIAQEHPEQRERVVTILTQYLEPEHTATSEHETRAGFIIGDLCDIPAPEALPAIRRAFQEDRVDTQVVGLDDVEREMQGLPLEIGEPDIEKVFEKRQKEELELPLRCTQCGRERRHKVGVLYVDLGTIDRRERGEKTPYDEFIITRRITCPKCGAVDKYELGGMAHVALTGDLLMKTSLKKPLDENEGQIRYIRFALNDGREVHPREGLEIMRREVAASPKRADLRGRLGNILRFLGYRDEAIAEYQAALNLYSNQFEACLNLGRIYGVQGKFKEAGEYLERALSAVAAIPHLSAQRKLMYASDIADSLEQVNRKRKLDESLLTTLPLIGERDSERKSPHAKPAPQRASSAQRVGRNDPCPCGSGKKYKHCHGK